MVATPVDMPPFQPDVCLVCSLCTCWLMFVPIQRILLGELGDTLGHRLRATQKVVGELGDTLRHSNPEGGRRVGGQTRIQATCNPGGGRRVVGETRTQTRTEATCNPGGGKRVGGETRTQATCNPGGGNALVGAEEEGMLLNFSFCGSHLSLQECGSDAGKPRWLQLSEICHFNQMYVYFAHFVRVG